MMDFSKDSLYFMPIKAPLSPEKYNIYADRISPERRHQLCRYPYENRRTLGLYAELLIRSIACQRSGLRNHQLKWCTTSSGKPYLGNINGFHFNITYAEAAAAVAVSGAPIGIDIEPLTAMIPSIYRRCFSPAEQEYLRGDPANADRRFYEIWTRKEAYVKFTGTGIPLSAGCCAALDTCSIISSKLELNLDTSSGNKYQIFFQTFQLLHYMISVCKTHAADIKLIEVTQQEVDDLAATLDTV